MSFVNSISATKTALVMSKIDTTGAGVSIAGEVDATAIGATLNGVLSQNFATNTAVDNKFVANQAIPLINPFATPFTWNDIASENFVNTRNFAPQSTTYTKTEVDNAISSAGSSLTINDIYPVGSIYFTASTVSPSTSIGGSWVRYAQGKCLFGVDDADTDFSLEQTGGEKNHTLTKAEIPPHVHIEEGGGNYYVNGSGIIYGSPHPNLGIGHADMDTSNGCADGLRGDPHNNLPPYIAIYIWKRTA